MRKTRVKDHKGFVDSRSRYASDIKAIRNAVSDKARKHNVALIIAIIWTTAINVISQLILS